MLDALQSLEEEEELAMTTSVPGHLAVKIRDRITSEMLTLTGLTAKEFLALAAKLPSE